MKIFNLKANCESCQSKVGLIRYKTAGGLICSKCHRSSGYNFMTKTKEKTLADIKNDMAEIIKRKEDLAKFKCTRKIGTFMEFDEADRKWLVPDGFFGGKRNPRIYGIDDIVQYELLEDGYTLIKGGVGCLDPVIDIQSDTEKRSFDKTINSLTLTITVNDLKNPTVGIAFIINKIKADSFVYRRRMNMAKEIIAVIGEMSGGMNDVH